MADPGRPKGLGIALELIGGLTILSVFATISLYVLVGGICPPGGLRLLLIPDGTIEL